MAAVMWPEEGGALVDAGVDVLEVVVLEELESAVLKGSEE